METECKEADFELFVAGIVNVYRGSITPKQTALQADQNIKSMGDFLVACCTQKCKCSHFPSAGKMDFIYGDESWVAQIKWWSDIFGVWNGTRVLLYLNQLKDALCS